MKSFVIYGGAALAEIAGCFAFWAWLKLDRSMLARTGGIALTLTTGRMVTVLNPGDRHPWRDPPTLARPMRRFGAAGDQHGLAGGAASVRFRVPARGWSER